MALLFTAVYASVDIGLNWFGFREGWTTLWPLNGVTIALLLRQSRANWPPMLLGIAVGTGIAECLDHNPVSLELLLRTLSVLEIVLSALVLPAFTSLDQWLRKPYLSLRVSLALIIGPGISGLLAAMIFHHLQNQSFATAFNQWGTADALGIAATMPFALALGSSEMHSLFRRRSLLKTLGLLIPALLLVTMSLSVSRYPLLFLIYPTLLLVDLILSFAGSAIAMVGTCFLAIHLTVHSHGTFGLWQDRLFVSRDVGLQAFLAFHVVALFPTSIFMRDRRTLVEDLNTSNARLLLLASLDGLTGLPNRRSLDEHFVREWKRAVRLRTSLALIMIDVDHFKQFNDLYGHHAGDECLQTVAKLLKETARRDLDHLARFGGEEFSLLLPYTGLRDAQHIAEQIRASIVALQIPHGDSSWGSVTVSLGCSALIPNLDMERSSLLHLADAALYEAKRDGRNRVRINRPGNDNRLSTGESQSPDTPDCFLSSSEGLTCSNLTHS